MSSRPAVAEFGDFSTGPVPELCFSGFLVDRAAAFFDHSQPG